MARTLVLDLDGTLVDSLPDLTAALNRLMASRGLAPFARQEVAPMIGDGTPTLLARAFAARGWTAGGGAPDNDALRDFLADYTAHAAEATRPFPGVPEALDGLAAAGWRLAVCTNKTEAASRHVLGALGLLDRFSAIGGGDSFPTRKPDPAHLRATLDRAGGTTAEAVMAGDHANDVRAAHGAGLPCIFAAWGYGRREMAEGAEAVARRFADLPGIAERLLRR